MARQTEERGGRARIDHSEKPTWRGTPQRVTCNHSAKQDNIPREPRGGDGGCGVEREGRGKEKKGWLPSNQENDTHRLTMRTLSSAHGHSEPNCHTVPFGRFWGGQGLLTHHFKNPAQPLRLISFYTVELRVRSKSIPGNERGMSVGGVPPIKSKVSFNGQVLVTKGGGCAQWVRVTISRGF